MPRSLVTEDDVFASKTSALVSHVFNRHSSIIKSYFKKSIGIRNNNNNNSYTTK